VDITSLDTGDVDLFPLNGDIVCLEDLLDRLGDLSTDTVTCALFNIRSSLRRLSRRTRNQGDGVFAAKLGGLEDVLTNRGHCYKLSDAVHSRDMYTSNILRETMDGPHRAGFAPRRSVWMWRVSRPFPYVKSQLGVYRSLHTCAVLWEVLDSMVIGGRGASSWW
jgi:hypothetical protein